MSTPSSPFGSHDLDAVIEIDLQTTIAAFDGDVDALDPDVGHRVARVWRETFEQSEWPSAHDLAARWGRVEEAFSAESLDRAELSDALLDLAEGLRMAATEGDDERFSPTFERLAAGLAAAGESLGGTDVSSGAPPPIDEDG